MTYQVPEKKINEYRAAYAAEPGRVRTIEHLRREVELLRFRITLTEQLLTHVNDYNLWAQAQIHRLSDRVTGCEESAEFLQLSEYIVANQKLARELDELRASNAKLQAARDKYKTLFRSGVANRRALVSFLRSLDYENRQLRQGKSDDTQTS